MSGVAQELAYWVFDSAFPGLGQRNSTLIFVLLLTYVSVFPAGNQVPHVNGFFIYPMRGKEESVAHTQVEPVTSAQYTIYWNLWFAR